jgi:hypothetical protein
MECELGSRAARPEQPRASLDERSRTVGSGQQKVRSVKSTLRRRRRTGVPYGTFVGSPLGGLARLRSSERKPGVLAENRKAASQAGKVRR